MKKYNFLSKAALLVAPFALAATFGAANAHAADQSKSNEPTTAATSLNSDTSAPLQTGAVAGDSSSNQALAGETGTDAIAPKTTIDASANDQAKDFLKDSADYKSDYSNSPYKLPNSDAKKASVNKEDTLENQVTNKGNKKYNDLVDTTAKSTKGDKFNVLSAINGDTQKTTDDNTVALANAMVNNGTFFINNVNNTNGDVYKANLQFAADQLASYADTLSYAQINGENVSNQLANVSLDAQLINNDLDAYNKSEAIKNSAKGNSDVAAEAKAQEDAVAADYAQVQAEAKAAAEAANKAKKPAKKHARKHARKFTVRVKAHKIYAYKSANFRRHAGRKAEKRGKKLVVYGVIKKGHKTYYRVFGHRVITANKHFVKRV